MKQSYEQIGNILNKLFCTFFNSETSTTKNKVVKRERRKCRKIIDSDSDVQLLNSDTESSSSGNKSDSDFSVGKLKNMRKRKSRRSSDTDSSVAEKRYFFFNSYFQ